MKHLLLAIITLLIFISTQAQRASTDFVTTWRTTNFGLGGDSTVVIPIDTNYTYNFDVDWDDDGIFDDLGVTDTIAHLYPDTGTYTVRIRGTFPRYYVFLFNPFLQVGGDEKLISLDQWGNNPWQNVEYMFRGMRYFTYNAVDTPNLSQVTSLRGMFAVNLNFNGDLSNWNVSNITNLKETFSECLIFNQPLNSWDVSNVTNFERLFRSTSFNQPLSSWNMSNAEVTFRMFSNSPFDQPIGNWDVSNVQYMGGMFEAGVFNQPLNSWQTDSVISLRFMFKDNLVFNQPLNNWKTDNVNDMSIMFQGAISFNQPLNNWNTTNVTTMAGMFSNAKAFNQDVGDFDISSLSIQINRTGMFGMLDSTNLSTTNYDSTLIKWNRQSPLCCFELGAAGLKYCAADSVRNYLTRSVMTGGKSWIISGDTFDCLGVGVEEELAVLQENNFKVYPNPSKGLFTIEKSTENNEPQEVFIYNIQGKLMSQQSMLQERLQLNSEAWPVGIYFVRLGSETQKLVVK